MVPSRSLYTFPELPTNRAKDLGLWSHVLTKSSDVIALDPFIDSHYEKLPTPLHREETRLNNLVSRE